MKLVTRTNNIKNHIPIPEIAFTNAETYEKHNGLPREQQQTPHQLQQKQHNHNLHFLQAKIQSPANSGKYKYDRSITTHLESNQIYDSVKNPMFNSHLKDWKIMTLQQLRRKNHPSAYKQQGKSSDKSRGIYVSVSQSKRNEKSREKQSKQYQDKSRTNQNSPYFKCLSSLNKKGQLIDRLQSHLENKQQRAYFC